MPFQSAIRASFADQVELATADHLSLLVVVLHHLGAALDTGDDKTLRYVNGATGIALRQTLEPGGSATGHMLQAAEAPDKKLYAKAMEAIESVVRLDVQLSRRSGQDPDTLLLPLYRQLVRGRLASKGSLSLLSRILPRIPVSVTSEMIGPLQRTLENLSLGDLGLYRSEAVVAFLHRWREQESSSSPGRDAEAIQLLLPSLFRTANDPTLLRNVSCYLLPVLFKSWPAACALLLKAIDDRLSSPENDKAEDDEEHFMAWVLVSSIGSAQGLVKPKDLPHERLLEAIDHEDADVRRQAFDMLVGQKDALALLEADCLDLLLRALKRNACLESPA